MTEMYLPVLSSDRVLVMPDYHPGPFILLEPTAPNSGTVLLCGSSVDTIRKGERVVFVPHSGRTINDDSGREFLLLTEEDICAII